MRKNQEPLPNFLKRVVLKSEKISDRSVYPWTLPFLQSFESIDLDQPVTIFVGENGAGKSTLIEGIAEAIGMNSEGGGRNMNYNTTHHRSALAPFLGLVRTYRRPETDFFLRAESLFNILSEYERNRIWQEPLHYLHTVSHGEGFLKILLDRFGPNGLYLLDEPESALSPQNLLTMLVKIAWLVERGSQLILATHSPIVMAYPGARLYSCSAEGITETTLQETEHYRITKRVIDDPVAYIEGLIKQ